ncbi:MULTISPECIES: UbiA family prenyltransferase [unclassified Phycicoccus]|uniref:UbiA family prenyltransferase n=1 Tax=unclassified Phycicoccus TaxID=2637926 RepID=UPI0009E93299|nr:MULTISPECIES: UbiA family prenyltransferase [unclassified Phycicoccus]
MGEGTDGPAAPSAARPRPGPHRLLAILAAAHPAPALAVTVLTALLAVAAGHSFGSGLLVVAAVATGQLGIGWSNDLIDADRDRRVGRTDKPVATGAASEAVVRSAIAVSLVACVVLSLACGWRSGSVHLALGVASGWAYNLGLKRTAWSAVPYAVAFGALPAVVSLALPTPSWPPAWMVATGAVLGVGAHLLNALPDLADDAATGVRGLPQRLGAGVVRVVAPLVLLAGSAVAVLGPPGPVPLSAAVAGGLCVALAAVAVGGRGRVPFLASIAIALVDVVSLVLRA